MAGVRRKKRDPKVVTEEQRALRLKRRLKRAKQKKEREAEGEVDSLNLIPMMDMMTILLVFLIKSFSSSGLSMSASGDITPPLSTTRELPQETVSVTITRCAPDPGNPKKTCKAGDGTIFVNDKLVLAYANDEIPPSEKEGGAADGLMVPNLHAALEKEVEKSKRIAEWNAASPFTGELSIIADKDMPYRMLTEILYTAGQAELDKYRFVVIQDGD